MVKAFPTAYGFGADTRGAWGGSVPPVPLFVTNLNDTGVGSLRAAALDTRPRVIIFRVSGTISCLTPIAVVSRYATFAGQTAPGDGICLRNGGTNKVGPMRIEASDIVIRFMKFRGGFVTDPTNQNHSIDFRNLSANNPIEHCIIDHCSISWGTDMNIMTGAGANYITVQKCLISECLANASSQGQHNRGLNHRYSGNGTPNNHFTDWANVFTQHEYRTPQLADVTETEVINNVVYHNQSFGMNVNADAHGNVIAMTARYENNYFKRFTGQNNHREHQLSAGYGPDTKIYLKGTVGFTRANEAAAEQDANGYPVYVDETDKALLRGDNESVWTQTDRSVVPDSTYPPTRVTATAIYSTLVTNYLTAPDIGAYRNCDSNGVGRDNPDATDLRVMADIKNNTGAYINRQWDPIPALPTPGYDSLGYPILDSIPTAVDSNGDGIPDTWAAANLPGGATANTVSPTGYTYLENYLNELAGDTAAIAGPSNYTVTQVGAHLTLAGGTAHRTVVRKHTAAHLAFAGGTHTATFTGGPTPVAHGASNLSLRRGSHHLVIARAATAGHLTMAGGTHGVIKDINTTATTLSAGHLSLTGGSHTYTFVVFPLPPEDPPSAPPDNIGGTTMPDEPSPMGMVRSRAR